MATVFTGVIMPKATQSTAITVSTTTQELDPNGAFEIIITSSAGADAASLPTPTAYNAKIERTGAKGDPKVTVGQLLLITHGTDGGSTFTITYPNLAGTSKTAATADAGDTLLLVAGTSGYAILENTGFTIA